MVLTEGPKWAEWNGTRWFGSHASVVLCLYLHLNPKTLICFPSQETIARLTCHDRRTVVRIIGDLVALGFIEKTKKGRGLQYRPVSPVHMSLSGCEIGDPTRDVGTHQTVSSFPTEVKENLKRKTPGLTFSPFAPDHLPTTDSIEHDEGHHRYPQQWMTRAHKMELRLPSKVQTEIRRMLEMDPNEPVTFQTLMELAPDHFEALWDEYGPPNG